MTPRAPSPAYPTFRVLCAAAWVGCMLACMMMTHFTHYQVHDADSRLYAAMAQDMAALPKGTWCAPTWNGHWERQGLFYEHPPGLLWAGAALIRLGARPEQALYMCNFAAMFASLALLYGIARALEQPRAGDDDGDAAARPMGLVAVALWMVTPAFLQYLVRGNQEHPLGFAVLLGLYALVGPHGPRVTYALWSTALMVGLAVKGIAAAALLPVAALYLARHDRAPARVAAVALGCVTALAVAGVYDAWARHVTGASFWAHYLAGQVQHSVGVGGLACKLNNVVYYTARPLWFGLPAVALLVAQASRRWRGVSVSDDGMRRGRAFELGLGVALVFVLGFSLANRKADRYIFPIYPALALAAADVAMRVGPWRERTVRWQRRVPYALMVFLMLAVAVKVYVGTYHHIDIRWWRGG